MNILFVSHDYTRTGAPLALLRLMNELQSKPIINLYIDFIYERGDLEIKKEFLSVAKSANVFDKKISFFKRRISFDIIFLNTIVSGEVIHKLKGKGNKIITWIHELPVAISHYGTKLAENISRYSDEIWLVNTFTQNYFKLNYNVSKTILFRGSITSTPNQKVTKHENLKSVAIVMNNSWKKGIYDLPKVVQLLSRFDIPFYVYGFDTNSTIANNLKYQLNLMGLQKKVSFEGFASDLISELSKHSIFISLSHEDAFPLVCLEAASVGLPIICWDKGNGIADFVQDDAGWVVEYQNYDALKAIFEEIVANPALLRQKGEVARQRVLSEYTSEVRAKQFLELIGYSE